MTNLGANGRSSYATDINRSGQIVGEYIGSSDFGGVIFSKDYLKKREYRLFLYLLSAFITSLYLFTVNISVLKTIFLVLGNLPGFVMFRNYYDKFSIGFTFLYAIILTFSLGIISQKYKKWRGLLFTAFFALVIFNALPMKSIVNGPLWKTKSFYRTGNFNSEYQDLVNYIKLNISPTNTILALPYNGAAYAVILDENKRQGYVGTSPLKILTGVNDITGSLSFPPDKAAQFAQLLSSRNYDAINTFLKKYNINYVLKYNNDRAANE